MNRQPLRIFMTAIGLVICSSICVFASTEGDLVRLGSMLPLWSCLPFLGMLLSIAVFPLVVPTWWEHHMFRVAIFWSLVFLIPFGLKFGIKMMLFEVAEILLLDYMPFIVLMFGLFVAAGGISIYGTLIGNPKSNAIMLIIGTILSSWVGTTGAAMLMIRPILRANAWRKSKKHVVIFFIFMVANMGGCLTPIGDPPLFLGFLRGVPFFWTMKLLPVMLVNLVLLLLIFLCIDMRYYRRELGRGTTPQYMEDDFVNRSIELHGPHNLFFILMIVVAVILTGVLPEFPAFANQITGELRGINVFGAIVPYSSIVQISIILFAAFLSMKTTSSGIRAENNFTFAPIKEVAKLFVGIFITMIPAMAMLESNGAALGLHEPWQYFWTTGLLSSFLDNAPTYLVFLTTAGAMGATEGVATTVGTIAANNLLAISAGAVFMGANTYIGNAPNFMVKSIAEENNVRMPSFFGYMLWALVILFPIFLIDMFLFFRP